MNCILPDVSLTAAECLRKSVLLLVCLLVPALVSPHVAAQTPSSAGPDVSLIGSWVQGSTIARQAGSKRALVVMVYAEGNSDIAVSSVTYGGQSMTEVVDRVVQAGSRTYTGAFLLDEAKIAAADASGAITVTWSTAPSTGSVVAGAFFANVNQTSPTGASDSNGSSALTIATPALASSSGDMVVVGGAAANNGTYTINNGFTRGIPETSASFGDITSAYKISTGSPETPSLTMSSSMRQTIVGFVLKKAVIDYLGYADWTSFHALSGQDALPGTDLEKDGMSNTMEYALGLNPKLNEPSPVISERVSSGGKTYLGLKVNRNPAATDVFIEGLTSETLTEPHAWSTSTTQVVSDTPSFYQVRDTFAMEDAPARFIRLKFGFTPTAPSTQYFQQGINNLVVYSDVPGVTPSNQYQIRVRSAATNQEWKSPFAMMTTASSTNGAGHPLIYGWTHTYANIEMNSPVEVEISKVGGQPITKGVTRPLNKTGPVTFLNGKAYFTMNNPAQVTLDVNGQMDDNNTGKGYTGPDIHAVSIFANPLLQNRPNPNGSNVYAVTPGTLPPTDGPWTTLYFLPGEHDIGVQFRVRSNRDYYIPGDALVHGSISNTGMVYNEARNIRIFGYGTLSGERFVRTDTPGADGVFTPIGVGGGARNVHVSGITIADPAYHSVMLGNPDPFPNEPNTVKWAKIIGWRANGDGINPFSNTLIEDTFIRTQDDSTYVNGLGMRRLVLWNDANGSSFVLTAMPQRSLIVEDCDIIYSRAAFDKWNGGRVFSLRGETNAGGAAGTGVVFRNIRIEDPRPTLQQFFICTELPPLFGSENNRPVRGPGDISNVLFENVSIAAPPVITSEPQIIWGHQNAQIRNFVFDNLTMGGVKVTSPSFFMTNGFVTGLNFQ